MLKPSRSTYQDRFCETLGGRSAHLKVVRFFRVSSFLVEERALQDFFVAQWAFRSDPQGRNVRKRSFPKKTQSIFREGMRLRHGGPVSLAK